MRLVTRADLDGLISAVLITTMERIDEFALIHPQDITDRKFDVKPGDIMANLPYHPQSALWFDHHKHTIMPKNGQYKGKHSVEPSVARVIYQYYGSDKLRKYEHLVSETDRFDSANLTRDDITNPSGVILLGFLIDPRTGLGKGFREFFKSLSSRLSDRPVESVLSDPDVAERVALYKENDKRFQEALRLHSKVDENVVITDFRSLSPVPIGNRFLIYTIFPHCNVSVRLQSAPDKKSIAVTIGHNILNRTCKADIGQICRSFGGGGHFGAGACLLDSSTADIEIDEIVDHLIEQD